MSTPTRFPGGIGTAFPTTGLANFGLPDQSKWITFFDDLVAPAAALGTFTAVDGVGGRVSVATTMSIVTPKKVFLPEAAKRLIAKAKVGLAAVADGVVLGICDSVSAPTKGITVTVANSVLTLKDWYAGTTDTYAVTYAAAEQFTLAFEFRPTEGIVAFFNDVVVASLPLPTFDATALVGGIYSNGGLLIADYVFATQER